MRRCAVLLWVLASACKPSLEQCVEPTPPTRPAACRTEWMACGTLSTSEGEVDCGGCPGELECGQLEPNVCGGIVCVTPRGDRQVLREVDLVWSRDAGVFVTEPVFGLLFVAEYEDSTPRVRPVFFDNRGSVYGPVSMTGGVVAADVRYSIGGSGGPGLVATCTGSAVSVTSVP